MPLSRPISVIDIGSNSVRLVIYDGLTRSPIAIFNEKVQCALAQDIGITGKLNALGTEQARQAICRFIRLSEVKGVAELHLFATAAVRDAADGHDFVEALQKDYGYPVRILSGEEEAQFAGYGILASIANPRGVVGDLGGGSLELIPVNAEGVGPGQSFPIGPLRIPAGNPGRLELAQFIDQHILQFNLNEMLSSRDFYAVGGAFRNLAKVHMARKNYPLKVIHNYRVPTADLATTLQIVSRMSEASLLKLPGISRRRLSFLPYAALILDRVIAAGNPRNIVFAATGVREGFLYSKLDPETRAFDPLLAGCADMMIRLLQNPLYGNELARWMDPLFTDDSKQEQKLRLAACILSEISCFEHSEYRAELAYRRILDSSLTGLSHKDRVFIAKALYCRYSTYPDENIVSTMQSLLTSKKIYQAQILGSAMRLARSLSCSNTGVLEHTSLAIDNNILTLKISPSHQALNGESVQKRTQQLAEVMGMEGVVAVDC